MSLTNLRAIFTDSAFSWSLKRKFDKAVGIYSDGSKIYCVSLKLTTAEDNSSKWKAVDTTELTLMVQGQLNERSRAILMEFDALDDDIPDEDKSKEELLGLVADKVSALCNNWQVNAAALCIDIDDVVTIVEDLSGIPKDKIPNTVQYQIAVAGNFEADTYLYSFSETDSGVWMEGIAKEEASKYSQAFQKRGLQLLALTAMPDEVEAVEDIDLADIDTGFLERGGMKAVFAAKSLAYRINPNFLQDQTADLEGWNYGLITAAMLLLTFLTMAVIGGLDFWEYRQTNAELEYERSQFALLESDRRKEDFINKSLAELRNKNQIIAELSENTFPWRRLLIHFGTIKIQGVWLTEIRSLEDRRIEIKGEALSYEAATNYVRALRTESDIFSEVKDRNYEAAANGQLVKFVVELSLI